MIVRPVIEQSQVSEARREATVLATRFGFDEVAAGRVALVVTELATNLLKHGGGGEVLLDASDGRLEVVALDRGPGMADVEACRVDGYSTAGSAGNGLGAVHRLASRVAIGSWPRRGTVVHAIVRAAEGRDAPSPVAGLAVPMPGEAVCGDGWSSHVDAQSTTLFMVDGLGHGAAAAAAAAEALRQFGAMPGRAAGDILDAVHRALRPTRGGAVAVARHDRASGVVAFAGLGNIAAALIGHDGQVRRMVSHNGTAGHNARRIQTFEYPMSHDGLLIMHSDGLNSRWSLAEPPGLPQAEPALIAALLYRDHARGRDDATVAVARLGRSA